LQRRLRSEGTSFSELRDQTRQDLALAYMRQGRLSVGEIAFLVGFSDQSNFNRAFRRWTGLSPREWRTTQ
ncbi:MAG: helix-turn-helix transcriptional regulator, partial [Gammaproteobacteria bacterium]